LSISGYVAVNQTIRFALLWISQQRFFYNGEEDELVGKPEGKKPVRKPRHRWVDNIKIDLREIGWDGMDWIDLAQDRDQWRALVNTAMNLRVL
jgi:hypothetical protein